MPEKVFSGIASALAASVADRLAGPLKAAVAGHAPQVGPLSEEDVLLLPDDVKELLDPVLTDLGFPLQHKNIRDTSRQIRNHYRAQAQGGYIAWLYLRNRLLEEGRNSLGWSWVGQDFANNGALGLFILSDAGRVASAFVTMARQWEQLLNLRRVEFLDDEFTVDLRDSEHEDRKILVRTHVGANIFVPVPPSSQTAVDIVKTEQDRVTEIMGTQAATSPAGSDKYFKDLVSRTNWPQRFKNQRSGGWSGDSIVDARMLINFAIAKKENPEIRGYTILGSLLEELRKDVGEKEAEELVDLICKRGLITDPVALGALRPPP